MRDFLPNLDFNITSIYSFENY